MTYEHIKSHKNQGFTLSLEDIYFEKPQEREEGQIDQGCFRVKYRQGTVDRTLANNHLYVKLSYRKQLYLRKNTYLQKDAAFLHFRLKESSENVIFP